MGKEMTSKLVAPLIRMGGTLLIQTNTIRQNSQFHVSEETMAEWLARTNFFFILGMGRSGTAFFANLLNKADDSYVVHEPVKVDFAAYPLAYHDNKNAVRYLQMFRKIEIFRRVQGKNVKRYGEVNNTLRRHGLALRTEFPNLTLIHLIRDGRDVVRSFMPRRAFRWHDPTTLTVEPKLGDSWKERWKSMDRFEKLCWFWQDENKYLRQLTDGSVQFEKLISDYDYFRRCLLDPIGVELSEEVWDKEVNRPRNVTPEHTISHWSKWDTKHRDTFESICGEEMHENGYEMKW